MKIFAFLLVSIILSSCFMGVKGEYYTYRERVTVPDIMRLDGYYAHERMAWDGSLLVLETMILWEDGTVAQFSFNTPHEDSTSGRSAFNDLHNRFLSNLKDIDGFSRDYGPRWGSFRVDEGTISIQLINLFDYAGATEYNVLGYEGVVVDSITFRINEVLIPQQRSRYPRDQTYILRPLEKKPPSENWTQVHPRLR